MRTLTSTALAAAALAVAACSKAPPARVQDRGGDTIYTTFYPLTYFAERIAGGLVVVTCPLPEDADPIFWQPSRDALAAYQSAGLIVANGAGFEKWLETASLPASRLVETAAAFSDEWVKYEDAVVHKHGPAGEHAHEGTDGHTWLDPLNAARQAGEIHRALRERWPAHAAAFDENFAALKLDLDALAERFKTIPTRPLLASHPAYNYLAKRFGWDLRNLDLDPDGVPGEEQLAGIRQMLKDRPAEILLWESPPRPEVEQKLLTECGLRSVVFSPCEVLSEQDRNGGADYLSIIGENLDRLRAAIAALDE